MRSKLARCSLGGLALITLVSGCSSSGSATTTGASGPPVRGGALRVDLEADPRCVDPHQSPTGTTQIATRDVLDGLIAQDPKTGALKPWLATSWQVSDQARRFAFQLRPGVTFSDGTPLDAAAVKANLDRIVAPSTHSLFASSLMQGYAGAKVTGPLAVTVSFTAPNAPFLQAASTGFLGIQSPRSFAAGTKATCAKVVGSGPFVMESYTPQKSVVLRRRPGYAWASPVAAHGGPAYLDSVTLGIVPDGGVRAGRLRSGQTDAITAVPALQVAPLRAAGRRVLTAPQPGMPFTMVFNNGRAPLDDVAVRRAVSGSIDAGQVVRAVHHGLFPPAYGLLTRPTIGYSRSVPPPDPAAAARLLDQSGWTGRDGEGYRTKGGKRLSIDWPYRAPADAQVAALQQLIQQQLKRAGIRLELRPLATGAAVTALTTGDYGITQQSMVRDDGDLLRSFFRSGSTDNFSRVRLPEVDRILGQAAATLDPGRRASLYAEAERRLTANATVFPVFDYVTLMGVSGKVAGSAFTADGLPYFHGTWIAR
ncbi:ABC transporter substrate-binding protein [Actinomadura rubrisoli]|uniref:ABC transporter substrate-binding protein n=1 Tax=Actinomadura rubrisoli TaxID=2530368 RepID=A0A4R5AP82_9ACTN|nr:ABC transporter substrate-binding protein [Actinomadura rubrisoli]TDD73469.1 ABC transporter substrate-binding protein [Actinomadura rubrisoli]